MKKLGVPVEESVAAIFAPICPLLPTPVTMSFPLHCSMISTALSKLSSILGMSSRRAFDSSSIHFIAVCVYFIILLLFSDYSHQHRLTGRQFLLVKQTLHHSFEVFQIEHVRSVAEGMVRVGMRLEEISLCSERLCRQRHHRHILTVAACLSEAESLCGDRLPGYELGVKAAILRLLFLLLRLRPEPIPADSPGTTRLKAVLQRVEQEYAQPLTVPQMAESCGCSSSHFMRWFKQMTGSTFTAYLNERRLAVAAEHLRQTSDSILFIAGEVGFENLSNFNRQFKARYGVSPREYRRYGTK